MKIKFQQRRAKPKCSIDKKMKFLPIPYQFHHQNLNVGWNVFLRICNNFSKQICLSKPVFNNISRRDHSSLINNTIISKIKYFPQLLALGPQIALKRSWNCFLFLLIITTKLDMFNILDMFTFARVYCKLTFWSQ